MVGYALRWGYIYGNSIPNAVYISSKDYDLRDPRQAEEMFAKYTPDYVIHLAAKVGGVKANSENLGDFYYDNIMINTNVLHAAKLHNVKKLISFLSTCIYPNDSNYPLIEKNIHRGRPHSSNFAYAYAKRMLDVQSRAYRQQFGCNFITVIANNLFGENDNFDREDSHVIPAMIRKMYEAKQNNTDVTLWGDGSPLREFTYSGDIAEILVFLLNEYNEKEPLNIGNTGERSIKEVAAMIATFLEYNNEIIWDSSKPTGQHRKPSDNSNFRNIWSGQYTDFDKSLKKTCEWFITNYPNVRGVK